MTLGSEWVSAQFLARKARQLRSCHDSGCLQSISAIEERSDSTEKAHESFMKDPVANGKKALDVFGRS